MPPPPCPCLELFDRALGSAHPRSSLTFIGSCLLTRSPFPRRNITTDSGTEPHVRCEIQGRRQGGDRTVPPPRYRERSRSYKLKLQNKTHTHLHTMDKTVHHSNSTKQCDTVCSCDPKPYTPRVSLSNSGKDDHTDAPITRACPYLVFQRSSKAVSRARVRMRDARHTLRTRKSATTARGRQAPGRGAGRGG